MSPLPLPLLPPFPLSLSLQVDIVLQESDARSTAADATDETLCSAVYAANPTLAAEVASTIASAKPIAIAATAGKDPTVLANFPPCAVSFLSSSPSCCLNLGREVVRSALAN